MFRHQHPYPPFIPKNATKLIVGTLPPPRFSQGKRKEGDVDFCYGSRDGQLWKVLERVYNINFIFEDNEKAVQQRKDFLIGNKLGICDMVEACEREKIDASDLGMKNVKLRNITKILQNHPHVKFLLFTGGNSKNGPEYFFRKHLKSTMLNLKVISREIPRIHQFVLDGRLISTVSLTAPSGSANRAVGAMEFYKTMKEKHPNFTTIDFRVWQYKKFFLEPWEVE